MTILLLWFVFVFLLGISVGSFINVCVARLPYEKAIIWPRSRCSSCVQPVRWFDNIPIVSYLVLGGRCRTCHSRFSVRYLLIELGTGLVFVGLFYVEMVANWLALPTIDRLWGLAPGLVPPNATVVFFHHALLVSFLLTASLCDLAEMEIPLSVTLWGTLIGLVMSTFLPWPVPELVPDLRSGEVFPPTPGAYTWPIWWPLPQWLPAGSWRLGLATGLAGAFAGMIVLRLIRFLFAVGRGIEGLGVGDADLMMMAGAFVGWQPILVSFFVGVFVGLFFALAQLILRGGRMLPFGPSLSLGVILTVLFWPGIGPQFQMLFFDPIAMGLLGLGGTFALLFAFFLLRLLG
jgi:leader peptidase (prepilin peptidase)/N-methyltransferase